MEANLKAVVSTAFKTCREAGTQATLQELAYLAVLLDARSTWPADSSSGSTAAGVTAPPEPAASGRLAGPQVDAAAAEEMGRCVAEELAAMSAGKRALMDLQITVAAAQEDQSKFADSHHAAREARLAVLARRAASVCASAADSCSEAAAARGTTREYERAFSAALAYVFEATELDPSDDKTNGSGKAGGSPSQSTLKGSGSASAALRKSDPLLLGAARSGSITAGRSTSGNAAGGSRGSTSMHAEVEAALDSVFPLSSVAWWVTLSPAERLSELQALAKLTLGVVTFNAAVSAGAVTGSAAGTDRGGEGQLGGGVGSSCGTAGWGRLAGGVSSSGLGRTGLLSSGAGSGTSSAGGIIPAAADQLRRAAELVALLSSAETAAWSAFDKANAQARSSSAQQQARRGGWVGPAGVEAVFCAQAATSLRLLRADASEALAACRALEAAAADEIIALGRTVGRGAAVPKDSVFPSFRRIGALRMMLAQEFELFEARACVFSALAASLQRAAAAGAGLPDVLAAAAAREEAAAALGAAQAWGQQQQQSGKRALASAAAAAAAGGGGGEEGAGEDRTEEQDAAFAAIEAAPADLGLVYVPPGRLAYVAGTGFDGGEAHSQQEQSAGKGVPARRLSAQVVRSRASNSSGVGGVDRQPLAAAAAADAVAALALNGWCAASIADSAAAGAAPAARSILLGRPADPCLGAARYKGALYGFSSAAAAAAFASDPKAALTAVRRAAAAGALLPHLWGISSLPSVGSSSSDGGPAEDATTAAGGDSSLGGEIAVAAAPLAWLRRALRAVSAAPLRVEAGTQTPTHFVEEFVDRDYEWNEWVLRRRIIALANLRAAATHSSQTAESAFRAEAVTQTWPPKPAGTQTAANKGSAMPRKVRYVAGLRGAPGATKMHVIGVDLDLGQPHQY